MLRRGLGVFAVVAVAFGAAGVAGADTGAVTDAKKETAKLRAKPELDIVRATAGHAVGDRLKHKITMRGGLDPRSKNTRPFLLINTKGGASSAYEYAVLGPRVFRSTANGFVKVGANQFTARKRTWVYRFKPKSIGSPKQYGWAALTSKGKTRDLAPNNARYALHDLRR